MPTQAEKELSDRIAQEFAAELRKRLGDRVQRIILYGSRARGDFWEWSDFDFVVIVNPDGKDIYALDNEIMTIAGDLFYRYDLIISAQVLTPDSWDYELRFPWGINVTEEGITL